MVLDVLLGRGACSPVGPHLGVPCIDDAGGALEVLVHSLHHSAHVLFWPHHLCINSKMNSTPHPIFRVP